MSYIATSMPAGQARPLLAASTAGSALFIGNGQGLPARRFFARPVSDGRQPESRGPSVEIAATHQHLMRTDEQPRCCGAGARRPACCRRWGSPENKKGLREPEPRLGVASVRCRDGLYFAAQLNAVPKRIRIGAIGNPAFLMRVVIEQVLDDKA